MTPNPTCAVTRDTLEHIVKTMVELECRHVPVLGRKHRMLRLSLFRVFGARAVMSQTDFHQVTVEN